MKRRILQCDLAISRDFIRGLEYCNQQEFPSTQSRALYEDFPELKLAWKL